MKAPIRFLALMLVTAVATWLGGWWAVPVIAFAAGLLRWSPAMISGACAAGWLALLLIDFTGDGMGRLGGILAGIMGLPTPALYAATLAFPALLGWSAASVADAARGIRSTSLPRS